MDVKCERCRADHSSSSVCCTGENPWIGGGGRGGREGRGEGGGGTGSERGRDAKTTTGLQQYHVTQQLVGDGERRQNGVGERDEGQWTVDCSTPPDRVPS